MTFGHTLGHVPEALQLRFHWRRHSFLWRPALFHLRDEIEGFFFVIDSNGDRANESVRQKGGPGGRQQTMKASDDLLKQISYFGNVRRDWSVLDCLRNLSVIRSHFGSPDGIYFDLVFQTLARHAASNAIDNLEIWPKLPSANPFSEGPYNWLLHSA